MSHATATELITYVIPALLAVLGWIAIELYRRTRADIDEIKTESRVQHETERKDLGEIKTRIAALEAYQKDTRIRVDSIRQNTYAELAKVEKISENFGRIEKRMGEFEESHGNVIQVIRGLIKVLNKRKP